MNLNDIPDIQIRREIYPIYPKYRMRPAFAGIKNTGRSPR